MFGITQVNDHEDERIQSSLWRQKRKRFLKYFWTATTDRWVLKQPTEFKIGQLLQLQPNGQFKGYIQVSTQQKFVALVKTSTPPPPTAIENRKAAVSKDEPENAWKS